MTPFTILTLIVIYFGILFLISHLVSNKNSGNDAFFKANKNSKWYLVAFGMIGTALSGVTFISVPGEVGNPDFQFKYFQFVLGNAIGFIIVAKVLLPLYYRMNLTSIYGYIEKRLGTVSYKTAATIFLISRTIGSSFRLYLVVIVLQRYVFDYYNIPFATTVLISLLLIFAYTYRGGLKTIIITDTLQTLFLVSSVFLTIFFICRSLNLSVFEAVKPITLPYYDDRMCAFICTIPEKYLAGRQIQIEYLKLRMPALAKITWQEHRPFNLYNYRNNKFPYNFPFRVLDKLQRVVSNKKFIQRNWELQFLGKNNEVELEKWLFENENFSKFLDKEVVENYYSNFKNKDAVYYSHGVSMLLTLSLFTKINEDEK